MQLGNTAVGERVDRSKITPESIIATAKKILAPYTLECVYSWPLSSSVADSFRHQALASIGGPSTRSGRGYASLLPRMSASSSLGEFFALGSELPPRLTVALRSDAMHTHSPKAGQGMVCDFGKRASHNR